MATNPLFSNRTSPNGATAPDNSLNDSYKRYKRGYNKFDYSRTFYNTERYADINVVDVVEGVEGDKLKFGSKHEIRSYTWKAPKMFDIFKKTSYFMTDMKAILPNNWEKIYKQPNKGDDVSMDVNTVTSQLLPSLIQFLGDFQNSYDISSAEYQNSFSATRFMKFILFFESIFSDGSLLASMNCHLSSLLEDYKNNRTFDQWLDAFYDEYLDNISLYSSEYASSFATHHYTTGHDYNIVSKQWLLNYMRSHNDWLINSFGDPYNEPDSFVGFDISNDIIKKYFLLLSSKVPYSELDSDYYTLNYSRLIAYQLVVSQFYSRDSVDDIYTAELWHQNQFSLISSISSNSFPDLEGFNFSAYSYFDYNGVKSLYDSVSGYYVDLLIATFLRQVAIPVSDDDEISIEFFDNIYDYLTNIFFYRHSLRYGDYFNGAKTLPYAPMDVSAEVNNSAVSALDITRSILMQRFANAVERVSNTWKDYLAGVTDGVAPPNPLEPRFLASVTSKVGGFEVENTTSDNQGNIVTLLKSANSNYIYELEVGSPCIVLGLSTYSVQLIYSKTTERFWNHKDRFDMFNKFMQNIGDQEITQFERSSAFKPTLNFAYTPRHMEYKQRYPIASGGFVGNLPGYAFIADNKDSGQDFDYHREMVISPELLRNNNNELDRFYASNTGLTLASYFHFILKYDNYVEAVRQMEYSPSIL